MKFKAVQQMLAMKKNGMPELTLTLESSNTKHTIDVEGQSMNIAIITDKMIEENNLKEVTSPIWFKTGSEPTDDGLFSPVIFGELPKERMRTHAYINLKRKFFHPYVFEQLTRIYHNFGVIASGQGVWHLDETGNIIRITDENDSRYDENNTGLAWLIENFRKIHFKDTGSDVRRTRLELLDNLSDDEIFISKWVVIPIFYRDYDDSSGKKSIPEINYLYNDILTNVAGVENELFDAAKHATLFRIQMKLVEIRKFGQTLIEKKNGAFQKTILGKAPDFGDRGVISVPSLNGCDVPDDCIVDIIHSGIPLSFCIVLGYPFMIKWIMEFFEEMFRNKQQVPAYKKNADGEYELQYVRIKDQSEVFTKDFIDKKLEMFKKTYGAERFEPVQIECEDGTVTDIYFTGKGYATDPSNPNANTMSHRPLTWTDVFYMAAVDTLSDKYCYITRYPLEDYFGTFPSQVAVLSTIKTTPMVVNGKVYPHYPVIDLSLNKKDIATQFIDTISLSNLYLEAIGGDYDGDTVSVKMCFSIEANQEAEQKLHDINHYVSIQGKLVRVLSNEASLAFYNMTRKE